MSTSSERIPTLDELWEKLPVAYREASVKEHEKVHSPFPPGVPLPSPKIIRPVPAGAISFKITSTFDADPGLHSKVGLVHDEHHE